MANTTGYDLLEPSRPSANSVSRADKATENTIYLFDPTTSLRSFLLTGGTSDGDNIAINGLSNSFRVTTKGNTITLTGIKKTESAGVKVSISMDKTGGTDKLWFADGSVEVTFTPNATGKNGTWTIGGNKIGKKADLSKIDFAIAESETFAAAETAVGDGTGANTFNLTTTVDTFTGTAGNDRFNAIPINSILGDTATTLQAWDSVDGGDGIDTLNIYTVRVGATAYNGAQVGTVKNVEIINIDNTQAGISDFQNAPEKVDASKFEGATQIWQIGDQETITKLAATTTAGFRDVVTDSSGQDIDVETAATATSVSIALDGVSGPATNIVYANVDGVAVDTITISGNIKQTDTSECAPEALLDLDATVSATATTIKINTAVETDLVLTGATAMTTLDLSGSTGGVIYDTDEDEDLAIIGGSGGDTIFIGDSHNKSIALNNGDDTIVFEGEATSVGASGLITGGNGTDTIKFENLDDAVTATASDALSKKVTGFEVLFVDGEGEGEVKVDNLNKNGANNITKLVLGGVDLSTYSGLLNNSTVEFTEDIDTWVDGEDDESIVLKLADASATNNVMNLSFKGDCESDLYVDGLIINGVETINITTSNPDPTDAIYVDIDSLYTDSARNISINAAAGTTFWIDNNLITFNDGPGSDDGVLSLTGDGSFDIVGLTTDSGIDTLTINATGNGNVDLGTVDTRNVENSGTLTYNISGRGYFDVYSQQGAATAQVSVTVNATNSSGNVTFGEVDMEVEGAPYLDGNTAASYGIDAVNLTFNGSATAENYIVAKVAKSATIIGGSANDTMMLAATNVTGGTARASINVTTGGGDDRILIDYVLETVGQVVVTISDFAAGDTTNIAISTLADFDSAGLPAKDAALALLKDAGLAPSTAANADAISFLSFTDTPDLNGKIFTYGGSTYALLHDQFSSAAVTASYNGNLDDGEVLVKLTGVTSAAIIEEAFVVVG